MTLEFIIYVAAGAFAGGFVSGLAGFGLSLFALGWLLQALPPVEAVVVAIVLSIVAAVPGLLVVYKHVEPARVARFLVPALAGIPLGLYLLHVVDSQALKLVIAGFLLFYGGFFLVRRGLPKVERDW